MAGKRQRKKKMPPGVRYRVCKNLTGEQEVRFYGRLKKSDGKWSEVRLRGCENATEAHVELLRLREGTARTFSQEKKLNIDGLIELADASDEYQMSKEHLRIVENHLGPYFDDKSLVGVNLSLFKRHLEGKKAAGRKGNLAPATIKKVLLVVGRLLKAGEIEHKMPKVKVSNRLTYVVDYDHLSKMLEATDNQDVKDMIFLIAYTGCRRSELANLRWNAIDFKVGTVTFTQTKNGKDHCIPMSGELENLLKLRLKRESSLGYVFHGKNGNRRNLSGITEVFNRLKRVAGLPENSQPVHSLRKFFASKLSDNGVPLATIQKLMNHSSILTTMRYVNPADETLRDAVNSHAERISHG